MPVESELRHDNFLAKVPKVLGEIDALKFQGIYRADLEEFGLLPFEMAV